MNLIQCDRACLYQKDGYCALESPAEALCRTGEEGCIHFQKREEGPPASESAPQRRDGLPH